MNCLTPCLILPTALLVGGANLHPAQILELSSIPIRGVLHRTGEPVDQTMDLAVLIYPQARGGSWRTYQRFDELAVRNGEFSVVLDAEKFGGLDQGLVYLEFRLRPSGEDHAFVTLTPRQPLRAASSTWTVASHGSRDRWRLTMETSKAAGLHPASTSKRLRNSYREIQRATPKE